MELERVAAEIRPRAPWEAVDLGFTLVRAWWRPLFLPAFGVLFPLAVALFAAGRATLGTAWTLLALWWAKPFADRVYLFVAGRALFGTPPSLRETLAALPRLWLRGAFAAATLERWSAARSFRLPVRQLEGLSGERERARARVLAGGRAGPAALLTWVCLAMEVFVFLALVALAGLLTADTTESGGPGRFELLWEGAAPAGFVFALAVGWLAAATLVGPFYVVAGFALYLNRRTLLEGWDVEIAFRRLAARLRGGAARAAALALVLLLTPRAGGAEAKRAEPPPPEETGVDLEVRRALDEVLAGPEFAGRLTVKRLRWKGPDLELGPRDRTPEPVWQLDVGLFAEAAVWLLVAAAVAAVAVLALRHAGRWSREGSASRAAPESPVRFGVDLADLPPSADVPAAALAHLEAGRPIAALSLLFRATLAFLVERRGLDVHPSWTEGECLRRLAGHLAGAGEEDYLVRLTGAWQAAAYAHRLPAAEVVRGLCAQWPRHFGAAA